MSKEIKPSLDYTTDPKRFSEFVRRLSVCTKLHKPLENTLANIFSMRYIGNKTHGDLAEVGMTKFVNLFMYDYSCKHVGKEYFRSKNHEEDIAVIDHSQKDKKYIPISLKAYGQGPLQLSTDKDNELFDFLKKKNNRDIRDCDLLNELKKKIKETVMFNVLPLICSEKEIKKSEGNVRSYVGECNILLYNVEKMENDLKRVVYVDKGKEFDFEKGCVRKSTKSKKRKHPIFLFLNGSNEYMCEVRYGDKAANALQRGFWSDTKKGKTYFNSIFEKWIPYEKREDLIDLIQLALNSSKDGHKEASCCLEKDIKNRMNAEELKNDSTI